MWFWDQEYPGFSANERKIFRFTTNLRKILTFVDIKHSAMKKYILALDQGTSSSRAIVFDSDSRQIAVSQKEFPQQFPRNGWVEHDPEDIWESQKCVMEEVVRQVGAGNIAAIGITNQRETTVVWDAETGKAVCNAIVWQDRRTAEYCSRLSEEGYDEFIRSRTGLLPDSYFSGSKLKWILDNVDGARERAEKGELLFGTVDSYLVWRLTGGKVHVTDVTNASRTMLFNIHTLDWDEDLLEMTDIPRRMLPQVKSSSEVYGYAPVDGVEIPVAGIIGDQQAALFGQLCVEEGDIKNTYGTGCFLLMNTGRKAVESSNRLLTTVAWKIGEDVNYALEGSVFVAGAAVQWLRDNLGIIKTSAEIEELASRVPDSGGVRFVPALTGLGAPYWEPSARGCILGISRGTTAAHIARAALDGIANQVADVVRSMQRDSKIPLSHLKVDGGASANDLLMQIQADVLGISVLRPQERETTALGACYMAGLAIGLWSGTGELKDRWRLDRRFDSKSTPAQRHAAETAWLSAVRSATK